MPRQHLLDESALLACSIDVDLNPVVADAVREKLAWQERKAEFENPLPVSFHFGPTLPDKIVTYCIPGIVRGVLEVGKDGGLEDVQSFEAAAGHERWFPCRLAGFLRTGQRCRGMA